MEDKSILNIDTRNKRLLIRADLNVPINNNKISDETRIKRFCSGISKLLKKNAKIIIITHLGRPKGKEDLSLSNSILVFLYSGTLNFFANSLPVFFISTIE